jgi:polysaccharide export outer membrane protein
MHGGGRETRSISTRLSRSLSRLAAHALVVLVAAGLGAAVEAQAQQGAEGADPPSATDAPYRIGVGDVLDVQIYEQETREQVLVRPDGRITVPMIGDVKAAGATPPELASRVAEKLSVYLENPTVTVAVNEIHSYRVYVLGEVADQQMIESNTPLRLLEALAIAGGFNDFAKKEIMVLRGSGPEAQRFEIDYEEIVEGRSADRNLRLLAGDVVVVR